jgi:hypothetical protein
MWPSLALKNQKFLKATNLGVISLKLKSLEIICQIGNDLSVDEPLYIMVKGISSETDKCQALLITISLKENDDQMKAHFEITDIKDNILSDFTPA